MLYLWRVVWIGGREKWGFVQYKAGERDEFAWFGGYGSYTEALEAGEDAFGPTHRLTT